MKFGDARLSPFKLSIKITDIELQPSQSSTLRSIFVSILPSANVQKVVNSIDYPESKITVKYLAIKVRTRVGDSFATNEHLKDIEEGNQKQRWEGDSGASSSWKTNLLYRIMPRPVLVIKTEGVDVVIEKTYLAPTPPNFCGGSEGGLPSAVSLSASKGLPTFDQDSFLGELIVAGWFSFSCAIKLTNHRFFR